MYMRALMRSAAVALALAFAAVIVNAIDVERLLEQNKVEFARKVASGLIPPEQVLLRPGLPSADPSKVTVRISWATANSTPSDYTPFASLRYIEGNDRAWVVSGNSRPRYSCYLAAPALFFVDIEGLEPESRFEYAVGNNRYGWSDTVKFTSPPLPSTYGKHGLKAAVYGDMGIEYSWGTVRTLASYAARSMLGAILHVGDMGYADDRAGDNNGTWYQGILNYFYDSVSTGYGAQTIYATTPGNHEASCDFIDYVERNPMPWRGSSPSPMFWSWTSHRTRFIFTSTEQALKHPAVVNEHQFNHQGAQYHWIKSQLEQASEDKNKGEVDWIILLGHRPFYCSYNWSACCWDNCDSADPTTWSNPFRENLESLLVKFRVDLWLSGHTHNYERTMPVINNQVIGQTTDRHLFVDPKAPLYIQAGAPGDMEVMPKGISSWLPQPAWSAVRLAAWEHDVPYARAGFGYLEIFNATHLRFAFVQSSTGNQLDHFWIVRT